MTRAFEWAKKIQSGRSPQARRADGRRQAKTTFGKDLSNENYGKWKKNPGRFDIVGIDTPDSIEEALQKRENKNDGKKENVPTYEPDDFDRKKKKRHNRKRSSGNGMGYSASWYEKLPWKTDPVKASRMAAEAMMIENVEDTSEMKSYLQDSAYDEIDDDYDRDSRSVARAYHRKMWDEMRAQEMYDAGMFSEKSGSDGSGEKPKKKRKKLTLNQKRDIRDAVALGMSSIGTGVSVAALAMTLSPKAQADFLPLCQSVYDHLRFMDPKGLRSDFGRTEDRAKEAIGRQLLDRQGAEMLAKRIIVTGGKGSRTLAQRIRQFSQS